MFGTMYTPRLSSSDWDRVVAVFAMGKDWQFKGCE